MEYIYDVSQGVRNARPNVTTIHENACYQCAKRSYRSCCVWYCLRWRISHIALLYPDTMQFEQKAEIGQVRSCVENIAHLSRESSRKVSILFSDTKLRDSLFRKPSAQYKVEMVCLENVASPSSYFRA